VPEADDAAAAQPALLVLRLPRGRALRLPPLGPPVLEPHLDRRERDNTGRERGEEGERGRFRETKRERERGEKERCRVIERRQTELETEGGERFQERKVIWRE